MNKTLLLFIEQAIKPSAPRCLPSAAFWVYDRFIKSLLQEPPIADYRVVIVPMCEYSGQTNVETN